MAVSHIRLNVGYLYRPANTWYELEAKATLFFYKITAGSPPVQKIQIFDLHYPTICRIELFTTGFFAILIGFKGTF